MLSLVERPQARMPVLCDDADDGALMKRAAHATMPGPA
jgi:hypothetical protein